MNREELLSLPLASRVVDTQAWGPVRVRQLKAAELPALLEILDVRGPERLARFCVLGCIDSRDGPLFLPDDVPKLLSGPLEPVSELATAFLELNGITDIEEEKKSPSIPLNTSPTVSPIAGGSRARG